MIVGTAIQNPIVIKVWLALQGLTILLMIITTALVAVDLTGTVGSAAEDGCNTAAAMSGGSNEITGAVCEGASDILNIILVVALVISLLVGLGKDNHTSL